MRNHKGRFDRLRNGVDHNGVSNAFARGEEATLAVHHAPNEARKSELGIAPPGMKPAAPKRLHPVSLHNSAKSEQIAGAGVGGMGHPSAIVDGGQSVPSSAAAAPLAHAYGSLPKRRGPVPAKPGMRSRTMPHDPDIGEAILTEALCGKPHWQA